MLYANVLILAGILLIVGGAGVVTSELLKTRPDSSTIVFCAVLITTGFLMALSGKGIQDEVKVCIVASEGKYEWR